MLLCIDIGNTNVVLGLFEDRDLVAVWRLNTEYESTADEYGLRVCALMERAGAPPSVLTGIAMCSVVPQLGYTFDQLCHSYLGSDVFHVDSSVPTGLRMLVDRPQEVGADRIVNAVAAKELVGGPACVVDFGTATKFDVISAEGAFLGGAIAPGLSLAAEALFRGASKLYRVPLQRPAQVIGRNTVEAMQSGVVLGYLALVEGMIARIRQELGPALQVIATGGQAPLIAPETGSIHRILPWLTLEGLRLIWEHNQPRPPASVE